MTAPDQKRVLAGRYRIDGLLGRGGMSEVFHGYDERLDRPVAIKIFQQPGLVSATPDGPEAAELLDAQRRDRTRFLREIRTTARLEHPGTPASTTPAPRSAQTVASRCGWSCSCCAVQRWKPFSIGPNTQRLRPV